MKQSVINPDRLLHQGSPMDAAGIRKKTHYTQGKNYIKLLLFKM